MTSDQLCSFFIFYLNNNYYKKDWTAGLKPIDNPLLLLVGLVNNIKWYLILWNTGLYSFTFVINGRMPFLV